MGVLEAVGDIEDVLDRESEIGTADAVEETCEFEGVAVATGTSDKLTVPETEVEADKD